MQVDFLRDPLRSDSIYICSNITVHNLAPISTFLGKIGDPARGGLPVEEFKRRQRLHREAEIGAMRDVVDFIAKGREIYGYDHFVNDAGGSVCELGEPEVIELLAEHTLIVYLQADDAMEGEMIRRAELDPKPLYYDEDFLDANLEAYLDEEGRDPARHGADRPGCLRAVDLPALEPTGALYQAIADDGYALDAARATAAHTEESLLALIAEALRALRSGRSGRPACRAADEPGELSARGAVIVPGRPAAPARNRRHATRRPQRSAGPSSACAPRARTCSTSTARCTRTSASCTSGC